MSVNYDQKRISKGRLRQTELFTLLIEFVRRVTEVIEAGYWVLDGNYGPVRDAVWRRATHLVWLDYPRPLIMARVIRRSLLRATLRTELWAGNRERWRHLGRPSHPIRWAWSTWDRRRRETEERLAQPEVREPRGAATASSERGAGRYRTLGRSGSRGRTRPTVKPNGMRAGMPLPAQQVLRRDGHAFGCVGSIGYLRRRGHQPDPVSRP